MPDLIYRSEPRGRDYFSVYSYKNLPVIGPGKTRGVMTETVKTSLEVNQRVREEILKIPNLIGFQIFDESCLSQIHTQTYGVDQTINGRMCWFVRYRNSPLLRLGPSPIMIIERETAEVFYNGSDGGE